MARCKNVAKLEPIFNACQFTSALNKCELIHDYVSYGSGENNDVACMVFHTKKSGNKTEFSYMEFKGTLS